MNTPTVEVDICVRASSTDVSSSMILNELGRSLSLPEEILRLTLCLRSVRGPRGTVWLVWVVLFLCDILSCGLDAAFS